MYIRAFRFCDLLNITLMPLGDLDEEKICFSPNCFAPNVQTDKM
ncbi:hypothetical protein LEP1GSC020_3402 [Leptospira interrogans serovar Grippotyphosa str. 2006006986]|nr:hypothetical protein LEP1GSC020_3402 [Leptospira interrogans serovar Grippotyphosa str. 2006006986]EKR46946.1 hypothetical protein LEP1GSC097_2495 [Leptospira interrogans serovar Grippotyphosa str. UI 08368]EMJ54314.1 hypothetical protein LEP1GSC111_1106 [Leptospira interrogans str. UT126]